MNHLRSIQDENHQLMLEKKQNQSKFKKFNDEILLLRQDQLEVESFIINCNSICNSFLVNLIFIYLVF